MCSRYCPEKSKAYYRTKKGLVRRIYNNQKMTSKKANRNLPNYTYEELYNWITCQPHFQTLYDTWVTSNYKKDLVPSIDRISNYESYTLNNIQLVTFKKNRDNCTEQNMSGEYLPVTAKKVKQYTLDGVFIREHSSICNALRIFTGNNKSASNISSVCNGKWKSAYGYIWKWAD